MRVESKTRKWKLARELGVNLDSVIVLELLGRDEIGLVEAAFVLERHRTNLLSAAVDSQCLKLSRIEQYGKIYRRWVKTEVLMEWAAKRRPDQRMVNAERAERYRQFDEAQE